MSKEPKQLNKSRFWVLEQIQSIREATQSDKINYDLKEISSIASAPPATIQRAIIFQLANEKFIIILKIYRNASVDLSDLKPADGRGLELEASGFKIQILKPKFEKIFGSDTRTQTGEPVKIRKARLDRQDYLLEINDGEVVVYFKEKSEGEEAGKATKLFKTIALLWESRWEMKNGKTKDKGEFISLQQLKNYSGCVSDNAMRQQIKRLKTKLKKKNLPISIDGENEKYQLKMDLI